MGIAAVLLRDNEPRSFKSNYSFSVTSGFPSAEKDAGVFLYPNASAFYLQKIDHRPQYDTNLIRLYIESWFNINAKTEIRSEILATDEYKGFDPVEIAETTVEYQKDPILISKVLKTLFLRKSAHNNFYPEPYLVICPELELEGIGGTKDDALADICQLFDIYFNETRKISDNPQDHLKIIEAKINKSNVWKQDFYQLYKDLQKKDGIAVSSLKHCITIKE